MVSNAWAPGAVIRNCQLSGSITMEVIQSYLELPYIRTISPWNYLPFHSPTNIWHLKVDYWVYVTGRRKLHAVLRLVSSSYLWLKVIVDHYV